MCALAQPVSLEQLQHYGSEAAEVYLRLAQQVLFLGIYPKKIIRGVLSAQLRAVLFVITRNWRPESRNVVKFKISEASLGSVTITDVVIEFSNVAAASCYSRTVGGGVA